MPKVSIPKIKPYYGKFDDNKRILYLVNISFLSQTFSGTKSTKALVLFEQNRIAQAH